MESPLYPEEKFRLLPLAALAVIFVIAAPVFWQEVELRPSTVTIAPENEDLRDYYSPVYRQTYGAIREGRIPGWDATRLCGAPLIGDPRTAVFQPLNLIFLLAPFPEAFAVHAFACLSFAGIAFVMFARSMGVGGTAALFGALCFAFSGAAAGAMSRPPLAAAMAWIPVVIWSVREHAQRPRSASVVFMGLAFAGLLLSGALAVFATTVAVAGVYVLVAALTVRTKRVASLTSAVSGFFVATFLCGCICAVQVLPTLRWAVQLDDLAMLARAVFPAGTLPRDIPEAATQLVAPETTSLPSLLHLSIVGIMIVPAAFLQRRIVDAAFYSIVAVGLAVLSVMYGAHFSNVLPPYAVVFPAIACAAAACALGADRLMRKRTGPGREWYWFSVGLVLCACVAVFIVGNTLSRGYATAAAVLVIGLLVTRRSPVRVLLGLLLCGLVWTNLVTASRNVFGHPFAARAAAGALDDRNRSLGVVRSRLVVAGTTRNGFPGFGDDTWRADGYGALFTGPEAAWWRALSGSDAPCGRIDTLPDMKLLDAMSVSTVLAGDDLDLSRADLPWVTSGAGYRFVANDGVSPRVQWLTRVTWTSGIDDTIASIRKHDPSAAPVAFIDAQYRNQPELVAISEDDESMNVNATASIQDRSPEHVVITMKTPEPGVLVLADTFSPDWQAEVNGIPKPILRVNGIFRGVVIPEGDHVVEFRYRPVALFAGGIVSIGTLAVLALWGIVRLFR